MTIKRLFFVLITLIFFSIIGYFVYDMSKKTINPWDKKKSNEQKKIF